MTTQQQLWNKLQENGLKAYTEAPEASCSVRGREDVATWREFLKFSPGMCVLDVGCGPVGTPAYLEGWAGVEIHGIDPLKLPQSDWHGMRFVKGVAEELPYPDNYFDAVLFASSLDHIVDQGKSLREAKRCLINGGSVLLWLGLPPPKVNVGILYLSKLYRWSLSIIQKNKPQDKPKWQRVNESLTIPKGAVDLYHFRRQTTAEVFQVIRSSGFQITRTQYYGYNLFLEAK